MNYRDRVINATVLLPPNELFIPRVQELLAEDLSAERFRALLQEQKKRLKESQVEVEAKPRQSTLGFPKEDNVVALRDLKNTVAMVSDLATRAKLRKPKDLVAIMVKAIVFRPSLIWLTQAESAFQHFFIKKNLLIGDLKVVIGKKVFTSNRNGKLGTTGIAIEA